MSNFCALSFFLAKTPTLGSISFFSVFTPENDQYERAIFFEQLQTLIISRLLLLSNLSYEQAVSVLL